jgi:branched-chain amino acid aminotransferase
MQTALQIPVTKTAQSHLSSIDFNHLEFGKYVADHMFKAEWINKQWASPVIVPFAPIPLSPVALALHYGQTVFEGMKAYRTPEGKISIFRLEKHHDRFNRSLDRMSMPAIPFDLFKEGLLTLIKTDSNWVPEQEGCSLYIRPFVFASEARLGVKVADEYYFMIVTSPVGPYYAQPLKVKVEMNYVRSAEGGTGFAKCGGNYGGSFYPTAKAKEEGFDQVLWTDAKGHQFIEESGTMNVFFVIEGTLVTPPLSTSILDGVTRDSILQIAKDLGIPAEVKPVSIEHLKSLLQEGKLQEAFGAGTAAVVAPIRHISIEDHLYELPEITENALSLKFKKTLHEIRTGMVADKHGWNTWV